MPKKLMRSKVVTNRSDFSIDSAGTFVRSKAICSETVQAVNDKAAANDKIRKGLDSMGSVFEDSYKETQLSAKAFRLKAGVPAELWKTYTSARVTFFHCTASTGMKTLKTTLLVLTTLAAAAVFSQPDEPDEFYLYTAEASETMHRQEENFEDKRHALRRTVLRDEALRASERGDYAFAAPLFDRLAANHGSSAELYHDAALAWNLAGKQEEAKLRFISGLKTDPDHIGCRLGLAKALIAAGDLEDICHHLRQAGSAGSDEARKLSDRYCPETEEEARGDYRGF